DQAAPAHDRRDRRRRWRPQACPARLPHRYARRTRLFQARRHIALRAAASGGGLGPRSAHLELSGGGWRGALLPLGGGGGKGAGLTGGGGGGVGAWSAVVARGVWVYCRQRPSHF